MVLQNNDDFGKIIAIRYHGSLYDHYGILDGQGNIIHVHKKKGMITCDPVEKCLRKARKVTYMDDEFDVRLNQYLHAKALIGSTHQYRFFTDNCESFIQKVRTGQAFSKQVDNGTKLIAASILGIFALKGISDAFLK